MCVLATWNNDNSLRCSQQNVVLCSLSRKRNCTIPPFLLVTIYNRVSLVTYLGVLNCDFSWSTHIANHRYIQSKTVDWPCISTIPQECWHEDPSYSSCTRPLLGSTWNSAPLYGIRMKWPTSQMHQSYPRYIITMSDRRIRGSLFSCFFQAPASQNSAVPKVFFSWYNQAMELALCRGVVLLISVYF